MPQLSSQSFGDVPLQTGSSSTLGVKVKSRDKAFYFLAARGTLRRYGRRFPCTEEGWVEAWTAFASEDPAGAALYRDSLESELARPASPTAGTASRNHATDDDFWLWLVLGAMGWLGGAALVYEGLRHVAGVVVLIGAALAFCGLVAAMYGVAMEAVRLARRTS